MGHLRCPENPLKHSVYRSKNIKINDNEIVDHQRQKLTIPSQPYFIPGYTGCTPGSGPQRNFIIGCNYGQYTHQLLHDHPVAGGRMNPLSEDTRFVSAFDYPPYQDPKQFLNNPHKPLDPYFVPGYAGWIPGSGIKRSNGVGDTYARLAHVHLAKHRVAGDRLRPVYEEPRDYVLEAEKVKFYCKKHEITGNDVKRRFNLVPGYTGHLPRAQFRHGKTRTKIAGEATAEFEQIMEKKQTIFN